MAPEESAPDERPETDPEAARTEAAPEATLAAQPQPAVRMAPAAQLPRSRFVNRRDAGCVPALRNPATAVIHPAAIPSAAVTRGFSGCGLFSDCELGDPWTLKSCLFCCDADSPWDVAGYVEFGYQDNPDGQFCGNGPFLNQREWNNLNLNQGYVWVSRTADGSKGLDWGLSRADIFYGVDGNEGQSFGNVNAGYYDYLNGWDHFPYEWAMPQLYGELASGDPVGAILGHFYTIQGYEVVHLHGQLLPQSSS